MTRPEILAKTVFTTALMLASAVHALPEDRDKPITALADTNIIETVTGKSVLIGNVIIRQGVLKILADKVVIETDPETDDLTYIRADGAPAFFTDIPETDSDLVEVEGDVVEFFPLDNLIITLGNSKIIQAGNEARGERITYNTVTGSMQIDSARTVSGDDSADQAELILQPGTVE